MGCPRLATRITPPSPLYCQISGEMLSHPAILARFLTLAPRQASRLNRDVNLKPLLAYARRNNIHQKNGGSWGSPISNLKGTTGNAGSTWYDGYGSPGAIGNNGDMYLDGYTGNVWQKAAGSWVVQFSIIGPSGNLLYTDTQAHRDALSTANQYPGCKIVTTDYSVTWRRPSMGSPTWYLETPEPLAVTALAAEVTDVTQTFTGTVDGQVLVNGGGYLLPNVSSPGVYFYNSSTQKFDTSLLTTVNSQYMTGTLVFTRYGSNYANSYWKYNGTAWSPMFTNGVLGTGTAGYHAKWTDGYHIGNSIVTDDGSIVAAHSGSYFDFQIAPNNYSSSSSKAPKVGRIGCQYVQTAPTTSSFTILPAILGTNMPANRVMYGTLKITQRLDSTVTSGSATFHLICCITDGSGNIQSGAATVTQVAAIGPGTPAAVTLTATGAANFTLNIYNSSYAGALTGIWLLEWGWAGA